MEQLIEQFDKNKETQPFPGGTQPFPPAFLQDGELSIVEFWSWVNGHDGRPLGKKRGRFWMILGVHKLRNETFFQQNLILRHAIESSVSMESPQVHRNLSAGFAEHGRG